MRMHTLPLARSYSTRECAYTHLRVSDMLTRIRVCAEVYAYMLYDMRISIVLVLIRTIIIIRVCVRVYGWET